MIIASTALRYYFLDFPNSREGQGDTCYTVKHFVDHDVYIRTDGFYSSYNGTDFDYGFGKEVKPKEKVITVYETN